MLYPPICLKRDDSRGRDSFKFIEAEVNFLLPNFKRVVRIILFMYSSIITWNGEEEGYR